MGALGPSKGITSIATTNNATNVIKQITTPMAATNGTEFSIFSANGAVNKSAFPGNNFVTGTNASGQNTAGWVRPSELAKANTENMNKLFGGTTMNTSNFNNTNTGTNFTAASAVAPAWPTQANTSGTNMVPASNATIMAEAQAATNRLGNKLLMLSGNLNQLEYQDMCSMMDGLGMKDIFIQQTGGYPNLDINLILNALNQLNTICSMSPVKDAAIMNGLASLANTYNTAKTVNYTVLFPIIVECISKGIYGENIRNDASRAQLIQLTDIVMQHRNMFPQRYSHCTQVLEKISNTTGVNPAIASPVAGQNVAWPTQANTQANGLFGNNTQATGAFNFNVGGAVNNATMPNNTMVTWGQPTQTANTAVSGTVNWGQPVTNNGATGINWGATPAMNNNFGMNTGMGYQNTGFNNMGMNNNFGMNTGMNNFNNGFNNNMGMNNGFNTTMHTTPSWGTNSNMFQNRTTGWNTGMNTGMNNSGLGFVPTNNGFNNGFNGSFNNMTPMNNMMPTTPNNNLFTTGLATNNIWTNGTNTMGTGFPANNTFNAYGNQMKTFPSGINSTIGANTFTPMNNGFNNNMAMPATMMGTGMNNFNNGFNTGFNNNTGMNNGFNNMGMNNNFGMNTGFNNTGFNNMNNMGMGNNSFGMGGGMGFPGNSTPLNTGNMFGMNTPGGLINAKDLLNMGAPTTTNPWDAFNNQGVNTAVDLSNINGMDFSFLKYSM